MTQVKICGIKTADEALMALTSGADMLGFVIYQPVSRYVQPELVADILAQCRAAETRAWRAVGVFVDEPLDKVNAIAERCRLDVVQLAGDETPEYCRQLIRPAIKSVRGGLPPEDYGVERFLVDTHREGFYGGTGVAGDWHAFRGRLDQHMLAGGLRPDNVAQALTVAAPWGVDVSSGVERDGRKDGDCIRQFIAAVREHDAAAH